MTIQVDSHFIVEPFFKCIISIIYAVDVHMDEMMLWMCIWMSPYYCVTTASIIVIVQAFGKYLDL